MTRPRIGLALGSGSARGWSHIGVIEALHEAGIESDIVCGSSFGAIVGAAYVTNQLPALKSFAETLTWREIVSLLDVSLSGGGLINGKQIIALLRRLGIDSTIENCAKPYAAIATDLETGREIWLREGPIDEAVRASIALPGIFSPARNAERWLVDGGLVNPVPISACRALGADIVIAVNLNGDIMGRRFKAEPTTPIGRFAAVPPEFLRRLIDQVPASLREQAAVVAPKLLQSAPSHPGYFDVLANSINIMQDQITRSRLAGEPPHVMLVPRLGHIGLMEYHRAAEAIAEGRACVEQAMPALRRYIQ
ncbi:MAG: patatin-like phospholipase family protein [Pseudolabrys sp.]|nr:patatin-like phospholipase family protein [Pseudolabrys sp.]